MKNFTLIFALLLLVELLACAVHPAWQVAEYIFKPSLMLSLGIYVALTPKRTAIAQTRWILFAIFFSLVGDVLLLFEGLFIFGLAAFLLAHLGYIFVFRRAVRRFFAQKRLYLPIVAVLLYGVGLLWVVLPNVGADLKLPIGVYALVILTMLVMALHRAQVNARSFWYVSVGAMLFVLSDSLIAVSKFVAPFAWSGVWIMLTYGVGQYLIVVGILEKEIKNLHP